MTQRKSDVKKAVSDNPAIWLMSLYETRKQIADSYDAKEVEKAHEAVPLQQGKNIVDLCHTLLKIGVKMVPSGTGIVVTPQMCMRVAFLVRPE